MRSSIVRRLATLALIPAALVGMVMVASPAQAAVPTTSQLQLDIAYYTNQARARAGCGALRLDANIGKAARNQSSYMAKSGVFSHAGSYGSTFVTRVKTAGYAYPMAENIGWGYRSGQAVVNAWLASPPHRANLLNCKAKAVGVGAVYAANGNPYFTQDFGSR